MASPELFDLLCHGKAVGYEDATIRQSDHGLSYVCATGSVCVHKSLEVTHFEIVAVLLRRPRIPRAFYFCCAFAPVLSTFTEDDPTLSLYHVYRVMADPRPQDIFPQRQALYGCPKTHVSFSAPKEDLFLIALLTLSRL
jgi:hypothetical protein